RGGRRMDPMTLLTTARAAGLTVDVEGPTLVVRGPRRAAPLAQALLAAKPAVLSALARETCAVAWASARPDEFRVLRARLACGCLRGYGWLVLSDGTRIYHVETYVRCRLEDLDDPRLAAEAAIRLERLQAQLDRLKALAIEGE